MCHMLCPRAAFEDPAWLIIYLVTDLTSCNIEVTAVCSPAAPFAPLATANPPAIKYTAFLVHKAFIYAFYVGLVVVNTLSYVSDSHEGSSGTSSIMGSNVSCTWQQQQQFVGKKSKKMHRVKHDRDHQCVKGDECHLRTPCLPKKDITQWFYQLWSRFSAALEMHEKILLPDLLPLIFLHVHRPRSTRHWNEHTLVDIVALVSGETMFQ